MAFDKAKAVQEAEKYVSQGKTALAIKQYLKIVEKDPADLSLYNTIGDLYVRERNVSGALKYFNKVADAWVQDGFPVRAIAIYKKISKLDPNAVDAVVKLAELYAGQGLTREARDQYTLAVDFYRKKNQNDRALEYLRKIVTLDPENTALRLRMAQFLEQTGRKEEAARTYLEIAITAAQQQDHATLEAVLKRATELSPRDPQIHLLKTRLALGQGRFKDVETMVTSTPALAKDPEARQLLLEAYLGAKNWDAAERVVLETYSSRPDDFAPVANLSTHFLENNDPDRACRLLSSQADPALAAKQAEPLLDSLRRIWLRHPEHIATLELLRDLYERTRDEFNLPEVTEALGQAYVQAEQLEKAESCYEKLLAREPENEHYKEMYKQVLEKLGKGPGVAAPEQLASVPMEPEALPEPEPWETAPSPTSPAPTEQEAPEQSMVREALENSDLYTRYNLLDKALSELDKVLELYPEQPEIHKRIVEICQRVHPERAAQSSAILAQVASKPEAEGQFEDVGAEPTVEPAPEPWEVPAAATLPEPTAPPAELIIEEAQPAEAEEGEISPPVSIAESWAEPELIASAEGPTATVAKESPEAEPEVEIDLSEEWESFIAPSETVRPAPFDYEATREEIQFYLAQGFLDEARNVVTHLQENWTGDARVEELAQLVSGQATPVEEMPEQAAAEETAEEWELPSDYAQPALAAEAPIEPLPAPTTAKEAGAGTPEVPVAEVVHGDLLQGLASDLEESLPGWEKGPPEVETTGPAPEPSRPEPAPARTAEPSSPLSGLLEILDDGATQEGAAESLETHYNLGVAFREMGLLDEAIGEFQKVVRGATKSEYPPNYLQACSLLATCFMEKSLPEIAAKWYQRAMETPDLDEEARMALLYDLGTAYEQAKDFRSALEKFSEVYGLNIDYRDVADKMRALRPKV